MSVGVVRDGDRSDGRVTVFGFRVARTLPRKRSSPLPLPLASWSEPQLFRAVFARGALQRTLWDGKTLKLLRAHMAVWPRADLRAVTGMGLPPDRKLKLHWRRMPRAPCPARADC